MPSRGSTQRLESQLAQQRAFDALRRMREEDKSLAQAAWEAHTTPRTVLKYVASALRKTSTGRFAPTQSDQLVRRLRFLTSEGITSLDVRGSKKASRVAQHWAAVDRYLRTGMTDDLTEFQGQSIRVGKKSYLFVADLETLDRLAYAGEVSFEDLYVLMA